MSGYGMGGYVGNAHDKIRIARQEKEREEARMKFEEAKRNAEGGAALRSFGAGTTEVSQGGWQLATLAEHTPGLQAGPAACMCARALPWARGTCVSCSAMDWEVASMGSSRHGPGPTSPREHRATRPIHPHIPHPHADA